MYVYDGSFSVLCTVEQRDDHLQLKSSKTMQKHPEQEEEEEEEERAGSSPWKLHATGRRASVARPQAPGRELPTELVNHARSTHRSDILSSRVTEQEREGGSTGRWDLKTSCLSCNLR